MCASWNFTVAIPESEEDVVNVDIVKLSSSEESEIDVLLSLIVFCGVGEGGSGVRGGLRLLERGARVVLKR